MFARPSRAVVSYVPKLATWRGTLLLLKIRAVHVEPWTWESTALFLHMLGMSLGRLGKSTCELLP